jgi:F420-dependent oxidoreductase-like protein
MKIGVGVGGRTIAEAVEVAKAAEADGFASAWYSNIFGLDALTACAAAGLSTSSIELGTFVVPTFPRHPHAMAQQASSVNDACGGRLALGIGLSHQVVIEMMFGLSVAKPAKHMEEYLAVLVPLLREGKVSFNGDVFRVNANLEANGAPNPPAIIVAALGPKMLQLTGAVADGTATWTTGVKTLADHIVPTINAAAAEHHRPTPRVVVALPVCVTNDEAAVRERAAKIFSLYNKMPSYRAMLDLEGATGPADVAIIGDEASVRAEIQRVAEAGATDLAAVEFHTNDDERVATRELLRSLL